MAKQKKCHCEAGAPLWIVTFGDLMSLLLTFFVLLLSMSTVTNEELFKEAIQSFRGSVGFLPRELTITQVNPLPRKMERPSRASEEVARRIRRQMQVLGAEDQVRVEFDQRGDLRISLPNAILFESASATLLPDAYPVLNDLAGVLADIPGAYFEVRGHTDNRPLTSTRQFRDNYDLSYARADVVARYLEREGNIVEQFEIIACGPSQPAASNETEEGRAANRRVEIKVRGLVSEDAVDNLESRVDGLMNPAQ